MSSENKIIVSYTLDREVKEKIEDVAEGLGISASALVNMQLRMQLGMVDKATGDFISRGQSKQKIRTDGLNEN